MKITKGHEKMLLYLNNLIRAEEFKEVLNEYTQAKKKMDMPDGDYDSWPEDARKKYDSISKELGEIIRGYETLRKRCQKVFKEEPLRLEREIAENYKLDYPLLSYAIGLLGTNEILMDHFKDEVDMCRVADLADEEITPFNKGEEIIHLQLLKQSRLISYPIAIQIHAKASKEDVIDFVEKQWSYIDQSRADKGIRLRKGKRPQEVIDSIWKWKCKGLSAKKIREMLRVDFPKYVIVYNEINDIIKVEKRKRTGILS